MNSYVQGGPGGGPERTPGYFEQDPEDEDKKSKQEDRILKWLFKKESGQEEEQKPTKPEQKPKNSQTEKPKPASKEDVQKTAEVDPASQEFQQLSTAEKKYVLAKREVRQKAEELEVELANAEPESTEALQVIADLALVRSVDAKLDNPSQKFSEQVEQTYAMIMERLDAILGESSPEEEPEELNELEEPETDDPVVKQPPRQPAQRAKQPKPAAAKRPFFTPVSRSGGAPSPSSQQRSGFEGRSPSAGDSEAQPRPSSQGEAAPPTHEQAAVSPEEVRQRRAGALAVSEALTVMLAKRYEQQPTTTGDHQMHHDIRTTLHSHEQAVRSAAAQFNASKRREATQGESARRTHVMEYAHRFEEPPVAVEPIRLDSYRAAERAKPKPLHPETQRNLKDASTEELLQIGRHISVDGLSLRDLYNRNEIDRKGLNKIVAEALRGGDVKRVLSKVRLGAEAQRGRKIEMRHDDPQKLPGASVTSDTATHTARTSQLLDALHAVQNTTAHTEQSGSGATIPSKDAVEKAVKQQRLAAQLSIAAIATAVVIAATLLVIFVF